MPEAPAADLPERMEWRVHPAMERRELGICVLAMIALLSAGVGWWMEGAYWSLFAFAVLFLSLEAFFLPSRYELAPDGVTVYKPFSKATRPWDQFRRVVFDPWGVTLSPFSRRHWLETYRAVRLRHAADGGSSAVEAVRRYILARIDVERVKVEEYGEAPPGREGRRRRGRRPARDEDRG